MLGHPADLEPVLALRDRFGVRVVEDAAESLGASYATGPLAGRQVGTVGDLGCYSFNGNKTITTGGGGMIVTADAALAAQARHLSTQAKLPGVGYVHDTVGYNTGSPTSPPRSGSLSWSSCRDSSPPSAASPTAMTRRWPTSRSRRRRARTGLGRHTGSTPYCCRATGTGSARR